MATPSALGEADFHADPDMPKGQEPRVRPRPFRAASVIIESGARVRRIITLAPEDESPFEEDECSGLLDGGGTSATRYSSIPSGIATRELCAPKQSWKDKFVTWIRGENPKRFESRVKKPTNSRVFKCSLAYWLGSLAVFWTAFAMFLGKSDGMHLVATVAVYFHPARTIGSNISRI